MAEPSDQITVSQATVSQSTDMTVRMLGIAKRFGTVTALEHVDFDVPAGASRRCWATTAPASRH